MSSSAETHSIDELVRSVCQVPVADSTELKQLQVARHRVDAVIAAATRADGSALAARRGRRVRLGWIPLVVTSLVTLVIAGGAVTLLGHRSTPRQSTTSGGLAMRAAAGLVAKLAVLRRPQTRADRLPAHPHLAGGATLDPSTIIPSLTRLVAQRPGAKLYLVVTTPARRADALWSPSLGDQVSIIEITAHGASATVGYPAADLNDGRQVQPSGIILSQRNRRASDPTGDLSNAYDVGILPDGVARVRWTFPDRAGRPGPVANVTVTNNVAITPLHPGGVLRAAWYAPSGQRVATSDAALSRALAAHNAARTRQALAQAEQQHTSAPRRLLSAFAVFSYNSRAGTRTADGYTISHPSLTQLPVAILQMAQHGSQIDLRQARQVTAPSGLRMYVIPGTSGICVYALDLTRLPYGVTGHGAGGGCSSTVSQALTAGGGMSANNAHGATIYGIVPRTKHGVEIRTGLHTHRTIHPADGVYIVSTPFKFG